MPGTANYLRGTRDEWKTDLETFERIRYENLYDGIDAVVFGRGQQLEYDFVVAPGADPDQIRVRFEGAEKISVAEDGSLRLKVAGGEVLQERAAVYQVGSSGKRSVAARYEINGSEVGFTLGDYDRSKPLVIDPVVTYSTWLGGASADDEAWAIATDASGAVYIAGYTLSTNFPTTPGSPDSTAAGEADVFVAKLNPGLSQFVYATYLGGSQADYAWALGVDANGNVYVGGETFSSDFPTTAGAFDAVFEGGSDGFVARLNASGTSLERSTMLGIDGYNYVRGLVVDGAGGVIVAGRTESVTFPTTPGAPDRTFADSEAFVVKFTSTLTTAVFSTFVGGNEGDGGDSLAGGPGGVVWLAGRTGSTNLATSGAYDTSYNGAQDLFVAKVDTTARTIVYCTLLGGSGTEQFPHIAVDPAGNAYVTSITESSDYPTTPGALDTTPSAISQDTIITKVNPSGSGVVYSTFLGESQSGFSIVADAAGSAYVVGAGGLGFPTTAGAYDTTPNGEADVFAAKLSPTGASLEYATLLGGRLNDFAYAAALDASGALYVAGYANSPDFPTTVVSPGNAFDGADAFVAKLSPTGASLAVSATFGGSRGGFQLNDLGDEVALDSSGNVFVAGTTPSLNFPVTPGAYDVSHDLSYDTFVTKLAPSGTAIVYSTFLGGSYEDLGTALALDGSGAAYVAGYTRSPDFPSTAGAYDVTPDSTSFDAFAAKLNAAGNGLVYSTFLGGTGDEYPSGIDVDAAGAAYVAGSSASSDFPTTPGAYRPASTGPGGFVTKLAPSGGALVYSTFVGSFNVNAIAVDVTGAAYVTGLCGGLFPTTPGAFDTTFNGDLDAFAAKLAPDGTAAIYSTFLGSGSTDQGYGIAVTSAGEAVVVGETEGTNFPVTSGAPDTLYGGGNDAFVAKFAANGGAVLYATYVGGSGPDRAWDVAVDEVGSAYIVGDTASSDFAMTSGACDTTPNGGLDAFLVRIVSDGSRFGYATYLGGHEDDIAFAVALDGRGRVVATGDTASVEWLGAGFGVPDGGGGFGGSAFLVELAFAADTIGVYAPTSGAWFLRSSNTAGPGDLAFVYGPAGSTMTPLMGDWDGDGIDTPGLYASSTGAFFLKDSNGPGSADLVFTYGPAGPGVVPVAGDFDGDGIDTIGIYVSATGAFFLKNSNGPGAADLVFTYGAGGADVKPVFGDFDGDGIDTPCLYALSTGAFFLKNTNAPGAADVVFTFGAGGAGLVPVFGDYDGDGDATVGVYAPGAAAFFLKNANAAGPADVIFTFGPPGATPLVGDWAG